MIVGMVAGLLGLLLPVTAPTAAAAPCYATGCNGSDPQKLGCSSGATTLDEVDNGDWTITELRYSKACHAVWTRVTNPLGVSGVAKVIGYQNGQFAREELKTLAAYQDEVAWTRMISATYLTYGCFRKFIDRVGWVEWCGAGF